MIALLAVFMMMLGVKCRWSHFEGSEPVVCFEGKCLPGQVTSADIIIVSLYFMFKATISRS